VAFGATYKDARWFFSPHLLVEGVFIGIIIGGMAKVAKTFPLYGAMCHMQADNYSHQDNKARKQSK
jgi:hypothetical protein